MLYSHLIGSSDKKLLLRATKGNFYMNSDDFFVHSKDKGGAYKWRKMSFVKWILVFFGVKEIVVTQIKFTS